MRHRTQIVLATGLMLLWAAWGWCLSVEEMVNKTASLNPTLKDYQVLLNLSITGPSIEAPRIVVKLSYKKPDKMRLDPVSGFAVLPEKQVLFGNPLGELRKHAKLYYTGERVLGGRTCYVVKIVPVVPSAPPTAGPGRGPSQPPKPKPVYAWLDKERFTLEQLKIEEEYMSLVARFTNAKYSSQWWLPQKVLVTIKAGEPEPTVIDLSFKEYKFNIGLQDSFFPPPTAGQ